MTVRNSTDHIPQVQTSSESSFAKLHVGRTRLKDLYKINGLGEGQIPIFCRLTKRMNNRLSSKEMGRSKRVVKIILMSGLGMEKKEPQSAPKL
ncbi:hypothetical protein AVEN_185252-1 [Araneus ventricosus]|uniref:Uncharacterized protein n=1 Tax=Araneus ventricosus TaxID=182803 RepID=A0A4Y2SCH2_ARAVE|nr:hypothetical protein AVEN_185252-1 [Araneus ventricosus]